MGCHMKINPVGFAFEHFDTMGAWRETETVGDQEVTVDSSGDIFGAVDPEVNGYIEGLNGEQGLATRLASSDAVSTCLVRQWYRYMMGRGENLEDESAIEAIHTEFKASGKDLKELLVQLAISKVFRAAPALPKETP
ncbi:MAG: DUF1585 domain-containing protein [Myxococcales bacterium]|nr:MAG: DUF1585 domain-containing protein [Myxococcales bacterium]